MRILTKWGVLLAVLFCGTAFAFDDAATRELFKAAAEGTPEQVRLLIERGADVNADDSEGMTPLLYCAEYSRYPEVCRRLLEAGADVGASFYGGNALTTAIARKAPSEMVILLLEAGADPNERNFGGENALMCAIRTGADIPTFRKLLEFGADLYATDRLGGSSEATMLDCALLLGENFDAIRFLSQLGLEASNKELLFHFVLSHPTVEALGLFLEITGDVGIADEKGRNLLMQFAEGRNYHRKEYDYGVLTAILNAGLDVDARDAERKTALMLAHDIGMVNFLLEKGADINAVTGSWELRYTPGVGRALCDPWGGGEDIPRSRRSGGGESVLMLAVRDCAWGRKDIGFVENLIDLGSDVDLQDARGYTPLMLVAEIFEGSGQTALIDLLVRRGASVDAVNRWDETALACAANAGSNSVVVRGLLEAGANVNARDDEGTSVLMKALNASHVDMEGLMLLLSGDVAPGSLRDAHTTALTLAMHKYISRNPFRIIPISFLEKLLAFEWSQAEMDAAVVESSPGPHLNVDRIELTVRHGANVNARDAAGRNVLMKYLSEGNYGRTISADQVARLIELGLDVNACADGGGTLLTMGRDHVKQPPEFLFLLLKAGADIHARDSRGQTCLHVARPFDSMKVLMEAGADISAPDEGGVRPIHVVDNVASLALLISADVDVNVQDGNGRTPLVSWMQRGCEDAGVELLLDAGADVLLPDNEGTLPLTLALKEGRYAPYVLPFLKAGADPNAKRTDGLTPLMVIAQRAVSVRRGGPGNRYTGDYSGSLAKMFDMLLEYGADPGERDLSGRTAWDYAAENPDPRIRELLAQALEKNRRPADLGRTPLMYAALGSGDLKVLGGLPDRGAPLESRDHYGWTALMHAAWGNANPEVVKLLIERGADVNARDHSGKTPLMLAAWHNPNAEVLRTLVGSGALLNCRDPANNSAVGIAIERDRPLEVLEFFFDLGAARTKGERFGADMLLAVSAATSRPEVVRMILDRGVPADVRDADEQTPLMKAVSRNLRPEIVKVLIDAGANVDARDRNGLSVLDYALRGSEEIFRLLSDAGIEFEGDSVWWAAWEKTLLLNFPEHWKIKSRFER